MCAMNWTKDQEKAIDLRNKNILVSAAAGSGKTSVLVERIRKMVCEEEVPIRSFLVVTFTNAAASEMKDRLRSSLDKEMESLEVDIAESNAVSKINYLRKQLIDLETANISTFHSFGLSVIRRFFYKLDIEPGFRTADETEVGIMKEDALEALLEKEFQEYSHDFIEFMDAYSGDRNSNSVRNLIMESYTKLISMPHSYEWMDKKIQEIESYERDGVNGEFLRAIIDDIEVNIEQAKYKYEKAIKILDEQNLEYLSEKLKQGEVRMCVDSLNVISKWDDGSFDKLDELLNQKSSTLTAKKSDKEAYEEIKATVKKLRDEGKKNLDAVRNAYLSAPIEVALDTVVKTVPYLKTLRRLLMSFEEIYKEIKKEQGVIDFDDIEHYCLELLEDDEVQAYYKRHIKHIFVDEYQDTNLMQEAIINRICDKNNLFMVGDIKQSIYKFRLAEPSIFQNKYKSFRSGEDEDSVAIDLNENHRSKEPIIDYINRVFEPLMKDYDEKARLYCGDAYKGELNCEPELIVLVPEEVDEDEAESEDGDPLEEIETLTSMEQEAHYVANLIKENLGKPFYDSKMNPPGERPLTANDIVILRRSVLGCQYTYQTVLKAYGIDSHIEGDDGYFDTVEVSGFLDLLQIIDNIRRDVSLISALHSEIFDFSAEELAEIRVAHPRGSYADAFLHSCSRNKKSADAYEKIKLWREMSRTMTLPNLLWNILVESGYYSIMGAMPEGSQRQANLRYLCDIADSFSKTRQGTLFDFLKYVESIQEGDLRIPEAREPSGADQGVGIMTIHKSKGLEFPLVIVSGLGKRLRKDSMGVFSMHKDVGIGLKYVNREKHISKNTLLQTLISNRIGDEELDEEIRILYVAMTRSRDRLFLIAHDKNDNFEEMAKLGIIDYTKFVGMVAPSVPFRIQRIKTGVDASFGLDAPKEDPKDKSHAPDSDEKNRIKDILNYKYPHLESRKLKSKYSVSEINKGTKDELKKKMRREACLLVRTQFDGESHSLHGSYGDGFTAAEKGTIYHKVMELLDFASFDLDQRDEGTLLEKIKVDASQMVEKGLLKDRELNAIDLGKITGFFKSDLGRRSISAAKKGLLQKERPFTLEISENDLNILVQGIIDCYFIEDGKTILIDYKSNRINEKIPMEKEEARIREEYLGQMRIYKQALEEAGLGPVSESYLYLLNIGHGFQV